jgi:hypothetical protein
MEKDTHKDLFEHVGRTIQANQVSRLEIELYSKAGI